jgi:hypothetical protein
MKRLLKLMGAAILALTLFVSCNQEIASLASSADAAEATGTTSAASADTSTSSTKQEMTQADYLAISHLETDHQSTEAELIAQVQNFIASSNDASSRSAVSMPEITLAKEIECDSTENFKADGSDRSATTDDGVEFYQFTLTNPDTGEKGFALTCNDNRIGNILAVVDNGDYNDDTNPFLTMFKENLDDYVDQTISYYNSITDEEVSSALAKYGLSREEAGRWAIIGPDGNTYEASGNVSHLLKTRWGQGAPYNSVVNTTVDGNPDYDGYVTGCGPTAMAQIMAYHQYTGVLTTPYYAAPKNCCRLAGYTDVGYDWTSMTAATNASSLPADIQKEIATLMYEIGYLTNSTYTLASGSSKGNASSNEGPATFTTTENMNTAFMQMGYSTGGVVEYDFAKMTASIDAGCPLLVRGDQITTVNGVTVKTGHAWVVDGYMFASRRISAHVGVASNYFHCNLGWYGYDNGYYYCYMFNGIPHVDTANCSIRDSGTGHASPNYFFKYNIYMIPDIKRMN